MSTSFSVHAHVTTEKIVGFVPFAHHELGETSEDIVRLGEVFMRSIVPIGRTGSLMAGVDSEVSVVGDGHYRGVVGVRGSIAPHARLVDDGTGVDGPFMQSVSVTRPPTVRGGRYKGHHEGRGTGVMKFQKNGEPIRYRKTVKATPSLKIQRNKNFSGKTHFAMRQFTRDEMRQLAKTLSLYWSAE